MVNNKKKKLKHESHLKYIHPLELVYCTNSEEEWEHQNSPSDEGKKNPDIKFNFE